MRLTKEQRRLRKKYTRVVCYCRRSFTAYLQIDRQGFAIVENTTKTRAEWYRDNAAIALARLIENERNQNK